MGDLPVKNTTLYNQLNYVHEMDWMQSGEYITYRNASGLMLICAPSKCSHEH